jgi:hypothetical protein
MVPKADDSQLICSGSEGHPLSEPCQIAGIIPDVIWKIFIVNDLWQIAVSGINRGAGQLILAGPE